MKTREEILAEIVYKHFENVPAQFKQDFHKGFGEIWNVALLAMKEYAEQALDLAADTVELGFDGEYNKESYNLPPYQIMDCCDGQSNDMIVFINKDSILSLKDQLK